MGLKMSSLRCKTGANTFRVIFPAVEPEEAN